MERDFAGNLEDLRGRQETAGGELVDEAGESGVIDLRVSGEPAEHELLDAFDLGRFVFVSVLDRGRLRLVR